MDFRRLFDLLPYQEAKYPQKVALAFKQEPGWKFFSTEECIREVNRVSAGFLKKGLERGETVAILANQSSPYWNFLDFGLQQIGGVLVPIHATSQAPEIAYILNDATIKYCIVSDRELYQKIEALQSNVPSLKQIFSLEKIKDVPGWQELINEPDTKSFETIKAIKTATHEDDLATIIYTSGTTGKPKGVMLSHKNIVCNIKSTISLIPINCDKKTLSFLPMSHVFERMVVYTYIAIGASVHYTKTDSVMDSLREVRPHYFTAVPRLLEKVYDAILDKGAEKGGVREKVLHWSIRLGERFEGKKYWSIGYFLKLNIADFLIYRQWRKVMGGRIEGIAVGAAALQPNLGRLFSAAGIDVREGYGLTETSPVLAFNRFEPGGVRFGTVGIAIPGVEIKIHEPDENQEGEIWAKGPNVMLGYYKLPEETAKVINKDGWFKTGDVGKIVHKRFLKITGRSKDIFKTSSGKYIAPHLIEQKLSRSPFIIECMIIGFNKPYVTALIVPEFNRLKKWCSQNDVHWTSEQFMAINPKVVEFMETQIEEINEALKTNEKVRKFHLCYQPWTVATGEYTPTLKLKRPFMLEKYSKEISTLYE